jgi:hypothetical protein
MSKYLSAVEALEKCQPAKLFVKDELKTTHASSAHR